MLTAYFKVFDVYWIMEKETMWKNDSKVSNYKFYNVRLVLYFIETENICNILFCNFVFS